MNNFLSAHKLQI